MSRIIVTTSGKGGVGKTTFTANLGMALARLGRQVALVDADFGLRNLDLLLGLENRIVYTAIEVISGECRLEQALVKDKREPGLVLLPAAQNRTKEAVSPEQMQQLASALTKVYNYVIIDSPAGIENGFQNAIAAAQRQALQEATLDAQRQANAVLSVLNLSPREVVNIEVNSASPPQLPILPYAAQAAKSDRAVSTPIVGGEQQVEASVTLRISY